jgi:hypothetical protein
MFCRGENLFYLCSRNSPNGTLTEWLGNGLQNRLQQFESARYLTMKSQMLKNKVFAIFVFAYF